MAMSGAASHAASGEGEYHFGTGNALVDAASGDDDVPRVHRLLEAGADPNGSDRHGFTALIYAAGSPPIDDDGSPRESGENAEIARLLIDARADVNVDVFERHVRGRSCCLESAVREGNHPVARLLVDAGADLDQRDYHGYSPLLTASLHCDQVSVRMLTDGGADVNLLTPCGDAPLHIVAKHNKCPVVLRMLLDAGADIEAEDANGFTPLLAAVDQGFADGVRVLIDAGADVHAAVDGFTPLKIARDLRNNLNLMNRTPAEAQRARDDMITMLRNAIVVWPRASGSRRFHATSS